MPAMFTINLQNHSDITQSFFFFQERSFVRGGGQVYSNALYCHSLQNYMTTGETLTFRASMQNYACIQQASGYPAVGHPSGYASAVRPIDLANGSGSANDSTTASVNPLGLFPAKPMQGVPNGSFAVVTPAYPPTETYNVGSAIQQATGDVVVSSFLIASPSTSTHFQPIPKFYVQTGNYAAGTVINFTTSSLNAAMCDLSSGRSNYMVTFNINGTWSVSAY